MGYTQDTGLDEILRFLHVKSVILVGYEAKIPQFGMLSQCDFIEIPRLVAVALLTPLFPLWHSIAVTLVCRYNPSSCRFGLVSMSPSSLVAVALSLSYFLVCVFHVALLSL